nr:ATP synthase F0 subunit 8 [Habroloma sp.]
MPQMAPLSWTLLFIMFSMVMILFMILNYYNINYAPKYLIKKEYKKHLINWKW